MIRIATYSDAWTIADIYNYYVINTAITCELECVTPYQMVQRVEQCEKIIPYLVYEEDEVVVGYAHVSPEFRERKACVHFVESSIYLKNGFGGKGIGFQLYSELLSRTVSKYSIILARMDLSNFASIRLHEKCGFTKVLHCSESARKFGKWIDIGFWQKSFGSH